MQTPTPLNIALVILHADPARGGAERYTVDLAHGLADAGHAVSLLTTSFAGVEDRVRRVPLQASGPTRLGRYLRFLDSLDAHLNGHPYDVLHAMLPVRRCDVYHPHAGIAAEAVGRGHLKYDGPVMQLVSCVANRMNRKRQRFAAVERSLLLGGPARGGAAGGPVVLCLSEYVKRTVRAHYTLPDERLATLFNAVDLARFDPAARPDAGAAVRLRFGIAPNRTVALMIAQDFERKGLREAIAAWRQVADERLVLLVVGKGDAGPYRRMVQDAAHERNVVFAGPTTDPYAFYRAADFFVLPTRHDPCSLVVLESLAMGVPVVSTVFNGACEIMASGRHGFVLEDPADVHALAETMRQMLDTGRRAEMTQACMALRPRLAYGHHVDELMRIYERRRRGMS